MSKARQHRQGPRRHAGAQGQAPSSQARLLASSPRMGALPAGVWHLSDHAVDLLAGTCPTISSATHQPSGARFRLASMPDGPILAIEALCDTARALIVAAWEDPTYWANQQRWRIAPARS